MKLQLLVAWQRVRSSYWFLPTVFSLIAVCLSFGLIAFDQRYSTLMDGLTWVYKGGPEGARAVLSAIASSVITVAGTSFSIVVAALSMASTQFGPRILRNFMRDTGNQIVLGTFTATFLYCLLTLRAVRGLEDARYVPHLAVTVGVGLAVVSVGVLIYFVHHAAQSVQVSHLVRVLGDEFEQSVRAHFTEPLAQSPRPSDIPKARPHEVVATSSGYFEAVDEDGLVRFAKKHDCLLRVLVRPGDYVLEGNVLAQVWPSDVHLNDGLRRFLAFGSLRSPDQDPQFSAYQLVDIGVRALSPSLNDPFTAIMCVDRLTAVLSHLLQHDHRPSTTRDEQGAARVIFRRFERAEIVEAAYRLITESAHQQPIVLERIRERTSQLLVDADADLRQALTRELRRAGKTT
ncbi:MAG TPA: DUF2254 domain-containing protein [Fimbriimonadaceae bacterium]|nr:DUF2254 domain-containing protein [Fimbriimonadaceae bacterium]